MSLQGSFDVLGFADVLNLLAHKRETGRLRVRGPGIATDFFFEGGRLAAADDGEAQPPSSEADARARVEEACFELLTHERGTFEFASGPGSPWNVGLAAGVERVLSDANRRLEEWQQIEAVIPSMDLRPRVVPELAGGPVTIDADSWRFLVSVDGRRNLHALARKLSLSRFEARRRTKQLLDLGLVEIDTDQPRTSIPHDPADEAEPGTRRSAGRPFPRKRGAVDEPAENGSTAAEPVLAPAVGEDPTDADANADAEAAGGKKRGRRPAIVRIESRRKRPPATKPEPGSS